MAEAFPEAERLKGEMVSGARLPADKSLKVDYDLTKYRKKEVKPEQLELPTEGTTRVEDQEIFKKAKDAGFTVKQYQRVQELIKKQQAEDIEAAESRVAKAQRQRQTKEWKDNRAAMRPEVAGDIKARPDVRTDGALRRREIKLQSGALSDEQKAALPKTYHSADGVLPDDIAGAYGHRTGSDLVTELTQYHQAREASGMKPEGFVQRMIEAETDRRMEAKYGNLDKNIIDEAKDQVLSETQEQLLHEYTMAAAEKAGLTYSFTREQLRTGLRKMMEENPVGTVSSDAYLADAGRAGRAARAASLEGDWAEFFRQSQRQELAHIAAKEARALEKSRAQLDKTFKRFNKSYDGGISPEFGDLRPRPRTARG